MLAKRIARDIVRPRTRIERGSLGAICDAETYPYFPRLQIATFSEFGK